MCHLLIPSVQPYTLKVSIFKGCVCIILDTTTLSPGQPGKLIEQWVMQLVTAAQTLSAAAAGGDTLLISAPQQVRGSVFLLSLPWWGSHAAVRGSVVVRQRMHQRWPTFEFRCVAMQTGKLDERAGLERHHRWLRILVHGGLSLQPPAALPPVKRSG